MKILKKLVIGLIILLIGLALSGATYQWLAERSDRQNFPAPGSLYSIDGLQLHLDCRGTGSPVVILEAGLTSGSLSWDLVHDPIAAFTRVCAYDRPGLDWSEPMDHPAGAEEVADRLHRLLNAAEVSGPRILVGMSAGGVYVREFYRRHPNNVVGMVLVDSSHEQQGMRLPQPEGEQTFRRMLALCTWLQPLGVVRAFNVLDGQLSQYEIPADLRARLSARMNQSHTCAVIQDETTGFATEVRDMEPPASLGSLPLVVLSQGKKPEANEQFGITEAFAIAQFAQWQIMQQELVALSSNSRHLVAERSGHVIQFEQPELVVSAITDLVKELHTP
ncbi:MAG: alpha/beta hydrolase [Pseudomonadales bacterium]|nr:alpha/beta hydrolase [Pseudomonadales bacterium]